MTAADDLRAQVRDLRNPLARIALAAGQLRREVATPASREQVERILDSVHRLERDIAVLVGTRAAQAGASEEVDIHRALDALHRRLAPTLSARGVTWQRPPRESRTVTADAEWLRRTSLELVRGLAELAGPEAVLTLFAEPRAAGFALIGEARPGTDGAADEPDLAELRTLVAAAGARLRAERSEGGAAVRVGIEVPA